MMADRNGNQGNRRNEDRREGNRRQDDRNKTIVGRSTGAKAIADSGQTSADAIA